MHRLIFFNFGIASEKWSGTCLTGLNDYSRSTPQCYFNTNSKNQLCTYTHIQVLYKTFAVEELLANSYLVALNTKLITFVCTNNTHAKVSCLLYHNHSYSDQ